MNWLENGMSTRQEKDAGRDGGKDERGGEKKEERKREGGMKETS